MKSGSHDLFDRPHLGFVYDEINLVMDQIDDPSGFQWKSGSDLVHRADQKISAGALDGSIHQDAFTPFKRGPITVLRFLVIFQRREKSALTRNGADTVESERVGF